MKLSILVDNNTLTDHYFYGEPAFSALIEDGNTRILFDTGYSDIFLKNAAKLGLDLLSIDYLVFSHGHNDHTGGSAFLIEKSASRVSKEKPKLIAHPQALRPKYFEGENIGLAANSSQLHNTFFLVLTEEPYRINDKLIFLGRIPDYFEFESRRAIGSLEHMHGQNDLLLDDSALVYKSKKGLVILTGCSHSGICNIIKYAQEVSREQKIADIIGGFHLLNAPSDRINKTVDFLAQNLPLKIHACHCTDLTAKLALGSRLPLCEVGSGMQMSYDE